MTGPYEWIDPFAEIDRLKAEIPRAEERGVRRMGEAIGQHYKPVLDIELEREMRHQAAAMVRRALPRELQEKVQEAVAYQAMVNRILTPLLSVMLTTSSVMVRMDGEGCVFSEVEVQPTEPEHERNIRELRRHAQELWAAAAAVLEPQRERL